MIYRLSKLSSSTSGIVDQNLILFVDLFNFTTVSFFLIFNKVCDSKKLFLSYYLLTVFKGFLKQPLLTPSADGSG